MRAVVIGVTGRMGQALMRAAAYFPQLIVSGAIAPPASPALGRDAGEIAGAGLVNLPVTSDLPRALEQADVALDFSTAAALSANLSACRAARRPLLVGTTGLGAGAARELDAAAREIALLVAPNTSLAVTLLAELAAQAARALPHFDIAVMEKHHRAKRDAPSGTALMLAQAAREARAGGSAADGAGGMAALPAVSPAGVDESPIASVRAGDIVGEHTVLLAGPGEQLALEHRATDRGIFARGALTAALWLAPRPPGRYVMRDLLIDKTVT